MVEVTLFLLAIPIMLSLVDWKNGLALCVVTALVQDPLRKLTPGQPVFFVILTGVVFAAAWLSALIHRVRLGPGVIHGWRQYVGLPFGLFVGLVTLQALHSYIQYSSPIVTGIGLMSYLAPVPAVVLSYQFALRRGLAGVKHWMLIYCVAALFGLSTIFLEFNDVGWKILGEVGEGLQITGFGNVLKAHSGIFRSAEVAAWHVATTSCFLILLFGGKRLGFTRTALAILATATLVSVGLLTGRRKMIVEVVAFVCAYVFLIAWFRRGATRWTIAMGVGAAAIVFVVMGLLPGDPLGPTARDEWVDISDSYGQYRARGASVTEEVGSRFASFGLDSVAWAIQAHGWFGAGLGTGSQGAQHFTGVWSSGAAEGGLGKITVELGVPGLLLFAWFLVAFGRYVRRALEVAAQISKEHARLAFAMVAFLAANLAAFSIGTQVYGDLFILLLLGWSVGFLLAMPTLAIIAQREQAASVSAQPQTAPPVYGAS